MYIYNQLNGVLSQSGHMVGRCYSGAGKGKNNPAMEAVRGVGPIPRGLWTISRPAFSDPVKGPLVFRLVPGEATKTHGRGGFLIHGDSMEHPGAASNGCIIAARAVREAIAADTDCDLEVI